MAESHDFIVVDKPSNLVVHGGDSALEGDLVSRLREYLRARARDDYLGVHQRLDAATSGVLLFTRQRSENAPLARALAEQSLRKRYVAVVELSARASERLGRGRELGLEHRLATVKGRSRVVRQGGQLAQARVRLVRQKGALGLCELELLTGRTHQLRVQLAAIGAPVVGDDVYGVERGSARAFRLMLHAHSLTLDDGRSFTAPVPAIFERVLSGHGLELGDRDERLFALADACCLRAPLSRRADCFRLVNAGADGLPGVTLDLYGEHAVLAVSSEAAEAAAPELAGWLVEQGMRGVYWKRRARADLRRADHAELAPREPLRGAAAAERFEVHEGKLAFAVELGSGLGTGLFVDQRENRERVQQLARGARVLNLFAHTCSFSVAAAAGGAERVISVDLSARALEWGRENVRLNQLDLGRHEFVRADALAWMASCRERFDLVILDPPSFATEGGGKAFSAGSDYGRAAELALRLLAPAGRLLAVTNHKKTSLGRLRRVLREAAERAERAVLQLKDLPSAFDCPPLPDGPSPSKSVLLTLGE